MIISQTSWRIQFRADSKGDLERLKSLKKSGEIKKFNDLLMEVLVPIGAYIDHEFQIALEKKLIPEGKYQTSEILDDLMIKVHDEIENLSSNTHLPAWLYKQAYKILEDLEVEEEFHNYFFDNIDDIGDMEWKSMDEEITRDGDGDLVMIEELDDQSYPHYQYSLSDVFTTDTERANIQHLDEDLVQIKANKAVARILKHLPLASRSVYNLHYQHGMDIRSIALIKKQSEERIADLLKKIQKSLKQIIETQMGSALSDTRNS